MAETTAVAPNGIVWAIDNVTRQARPVYNVGEVPEDYRTILEAAPMMYKVIEDVVPALDTLIAFLEDHQLEAPVHAILQLQGALNTCRVCALEGVIKTLDARK